MHELKLRVADYVRMEEIQTPNFATTMQPPPPTLPHNLTHVLIPAHANPANLASPDMPLLP